MNLGAFYRSIGKIEPSIEHYNEFIRRFPNDANVPFVIDSIKLMEEKLAVVKKIKVRSNEEYYAEATVRQVSTWPRKSMPLKVYVQERISASAEKVKIRFVDKPGWPTLSVFGPAIPANSETERRAAKRWFCLKKV